jgi:hypothetical protein
MPLSKPSFVSERAAPEPQDRPSPRSRVKPPALAALSPASFPAAVRWQAETDYAASLSPEDRRWLAEFNNATIAGDFRSELGLRFSRDERREIWRDLKRQQRHAPAVAPVALLRGDEADAGFPGVVDEALADVGREWRQVRASSEQLRLAARVRELAKRVEAGQTRWAGPHRAAVRELVRLNCAQNPSCER